MLLLDEPFDGVDPLGVEATMEVIADARARGAAVLVSTHLRELAVQACQHAIVLRGGSAVAELSRRRDGRGGRGRCLPRAPRLRPGGSTSRRSAALFRFRARGAARAARRRAAPVALGVIGLVTLAVAVLPAFLARARR